MQIQRLLRRKKVICEACGLEYGVNKQDLRDLHDMMPERGDEAPNLLKPEDMGKFNRPNTRRLLKKPRMPPIRPKPSLKTTHPRINKDVILRALSFNWMTLKDLAQKIEVVGRKEFYVLRMKLNELNRNGYIQMDFQMDKVLIRKLRQNKRTN